MKTVKFSVNDIFTESTELLSHNSEIDVAKNSKRILHYIILIAYRDIFTKVFKKLTSFRLKIKL